MKALKNKTIILRIITSLILIIIIFSYKFAVNDPNKVNLLNRFALRSPEYPLGTDSLGRCIYSRLLYGGFTSVGIAVIGGVFVLIIGIFIGLFLAKIEGRSSILAESFLNAVTAIPPIAYLIIFISAWGNSIFTMMIAIMITLFLRLIKLVKSITEVELKKAYIICAITSGAGNSRILFFHVLPNILEPCIRFVCLSSVDMILAISAFSFIGLNMGDDVIDWGRMVSDAQNVILSNPMETIYPILLIIVSALMLNILGRTFKAGDSNA